MLLEPSCTSDLALGSYFFMTRRDADEGHRIVFERDAGRPVDREAPDARRRPGALDDELKQTGDLVLHGDGAAGKISALQQAGQAAGMAPQDAGTAATSIASFPRGLLDWLSADCARHSGRA